MFRNWEENFSNLNGWLEPGNWIQNSLKMQNPKYGERMESWDMAIISEHRICGGLCNLRNIECSFAIPESIWYGTEMRSNETWCIKHLFRGKWVYIDKSKVEPELKFEEFPASTFIFASLRFEPIIPSN